jgi:hypothetical protein
MALDLNQDIFDENRDIRRENDENADALFKAVKILVEKLFHSLARKYRIPYTYVGLALTNAAANANVDVDINREGIARTFKNKSGESIVIGDKVYVFAVDGSLSSAFVLVKY